MAKRLWELFYTFAKVGVMTFGGGYAMLPILQREVVENKGWATEEELAELEEIIRAHKIDEWNDFCKLDLCMCSGNSWTIHVTYRESRDEYIHAMGHSEAPDGFAEGKRAIEAFFERYL